VLASYQSRAHVIRSCWNETVL